MTNKEPKFFDLATIKDDETYFDLEPTEDNQKQ